MGNIKEIIGRGQKLILEIKPILSRTRRRDDLSVRDLLRTSLYSAVIQPMLHHELTNEKHIRFLFMVLGGVLKNKDMVSLASSPMIRELFNSYADFICFTGLDMLRAADLVEGTDFAEQFIRLAEEILIEIKSAEIINRPFSDQLSKGSQDKNSELVNPESVFISSQINTETAYLPELFLKKLEKASKTKIPLSQERTKQKPSKPRRIHGGAQESDLDSALSELNKLIGLASVKAEIIKLVNFVQVQRMRRAHGLKDNDLVLHSVFLGNPGTGKTTVARLLGKVYKSLGVLSKGHLVETDRAGLVAGYIGQTAIKTDEVVNKAKGGVLFIDEAYSLADQEAGSSDFGKESLETLLKRMEDSRRDLVVIVAGYTAEMENFLKSNPGLESRFPRKIAFEDFEMEQLFAIFEHLCVEQEYKLSDDARSALRVQLSFAYENRNAHFGNARFVRNLFEATIRNHSTRIGAKMGITGEDLIVLVGEDVPNDLKD